MPGDQMFYILSKTKIQDAQSTYQSDRDMILGMIESSVGYTALNNKVNEFIRGWIRDAIKEIIEEKLEKVDAEFAIAGGSEDDGDLISTNEILENFNKVKKLSI